MESSFLLIGGTGPCDGPLPELDEVIAVSDSHVVLSVRAQAGPVRVEFWSDVEARSAQVLFQGEIDLPDGRLCVADFDGLVRYVRRHGSKGRQPITIAVDEPQSVSRVFVVSGVVADAAAGGFEGPSFGAVGPATRHPRHLDLVNYYLTDHDSPVARLSAVVHAISVDLNQPRSERNYEIFMIREWLRWLSVELRSDECARAAERIREFVSTPADRETATEFASLVISELVAAGSGK